MEEWNTRGAQLSKDFDQLDASKKRAGFLRVAALTLGLLAGGAGFVGAMIMTGGGSLLAIGASIALGLAPAAAGAFTAGKLDKQHYELVGKLGRLGETFRQETKIL